MTFCSCSMHSLLECMNISTIIFRIISLKSTSPVLTFHLNSSPIFLDTQKISLSWISCNPFFCCLWNSVCVCISLLPSQRLSQCLSLGSAGASLASLLSFPHSPSWIHQWVFHQSIPTNRTVLNSSAASTPIQTSISYLESWDGFLTAFCFCSFMIHPPQSSQSDLFPPSFIQI